MRRLPELILPAALACASAAAAASAQTAPPGPKRAPAPAAAIRADPAAALRTARVVYVGSGTPFFEAARLRDELRKQSDFAAWRMAITGDGEGREPADIEVEIDRPLFTDTFTYRLTDRRTGRALAAGEVTGWDGDAAAPKLAKRIVEEIRRARRPSPGRKNASQEGKKAARDGGRAQAKN
ncbi:MAG: hypothetical protein LC800_22345 [Acidobacteria bacterium]|nr:hypothetical protein [Acidobacteriota bacterium]